MALIELKDGGSFHGELLVITRWYTVMYGTHDGSMVLLYMVLHGSHQQKTPYVSINIPAPWIRHGV